MTSSRCIVIALLVLTGSITASTYYVSPDGSDRNPGSLHKAIDSFKNAVRVQTECLGEQGFKRR